MHLKKHLALRHILLFVCMIIVFWQTFPAHAETMQPEIVLDPATPGPGDITIVTIKGGLNATVEGTFNGQKMYFNRSGENFKAILAIDLFTEPGSYPLDADVNGTKQSRPVTVIKKEYPVQKLTLPKNMVELSPENEARVEREQKKMSAIWPHENARIWSGDFSNPLEGEIITVFGVRRIMNDIPKRPHSGVDVEGKTGAKVRAPNSGVVTLVDTQYFGGKSLVIDHGQGIYTMYFHLSKVLVKKGQRVNKAEVIARVGSTGRATGPHLHWGVRVQGARVDPLELIHLKLE